MDGRRAGARRRSWSAAGGAAWSWPTSREPHRHRRHDRSRGPGRAGRRHAGRQRATAVRQRTGRVHRPAAGRRSRGSMRSSRARRRRSACRHPLRRHGAHRAAARAGRPLRPGAGHAAARVVGACALLQRAELRRPHRPPGRRRAARPVGRRRPGRALSRRPTSPSPSRAPAATATRRAAPSASARSPPTCCSSRASLAATAVLNWPLGLVLLPCLLPALTVLAVATAWGVWRTPAQHGAEPGDGEPAARRRGAADGGALPDRALRRRRGAGVVRAGRAADPLPPRSA